MKTILIRSKNISATEYYYNIVSEALKQCSDLVFDGFEGEEIPAGHKDALVVVGSCLSMVQLWLKGYRKLAVWYQGVLPEESYMRNKNKIRMGILETIEKFSLRHAKLQILVSDAMREHYERKYGRKISDYYIMPCFNTEYESNRILEKVYDGKVFTYTGGLSKWQCIDQTLMLYKKIEQASGNTTKLLLLTPEQEKARQMVEQYGIVNAQIKCVHYTELSEALKEVTFGFALREDNAVNRVATPTKLANYVANGIFPIYTSCVQDFAKISAGNPYKAVIEDVNQVTDGEVQQIMGLMKNMPASQEAEHSFGAYFADYYNPEKHAQELARVIGKIGIV